MLKKLIFLFIIFVNFAVFSQNTEAKIHKLKGRIIDVKTRFPLKSAHILNMNTVIGTITNRFG